jgi:hypothetical protein
MKTKFQKLIIGSSLILGVGALSTIMLPLQSCGKKSNDNYFKVNPLPQTSDFYNIVDENIVVNGQTITKHNVIKSFSDAFMDACATSELAVLQYIENNSSLTMQQLTRDGFTIDLSNRLLDSNVEFCDSATDYSKNIMHLVTHLDFYNSSWLVEGSKDVADAEFYSGYYTFQHGEFNSLIDINFDKTNFFYNNPNVNLPGATYND